MEFCFLLHIELLESYHLVHDCPSHVDQIAADFREKFGKKGIMISAVDLLKGIAVGSGIHNISVEGANGGLHTNYEGKAAAAVEALTRRDYDFAYIHIEAPDEMGHQGQTQDKIKAIEYVDQRVLKPVVDGLREAKEDFRLLLLPDHPTPIEVEMSLYEENLNKTIIQNGERKGADPDGV